MNELSDDTAITRDKFEDLLKKIDKGLRALPATAQVWHCISYWVGYCHSGKHNSSFHNLIGHFGFQDLRAVMQSVWPGHLPIVDPIDNRFAYFANAVNFWYTYCFSLPRNTFFHEPCPYIQTNYFSQKVVASFQWHCLNSKASLKQVSICQKTIGHSFADSPTPKR